VKLSHPLAQCPVLLQQTHLADLALAYRALDDFAGRIARTQLRGHCNLRQARPAARRCGATLTSLEGSQAVIEEHFTGEDLTVLADAIACATGTSDLDLTFRIERLPERFLAPLLRQFAEAGVFTDHDSILV
jgi:hypothetical protein